MAKTEPTQKDLDSQYRKPSGALGRKIGREMARDHFPENLWTIAQLNPQPSDHILEIGFGSGIATEELLKHVTTGEVLQVLRNRCEDGRHSFHISGGCVKLPNSSIDVAAICGYT
ncbi:MAG TPA: hypothetical protein VEX13_08960 [Chloroflexia bacterium]|nr:hypothetical protein [Chloroflexia bacterium]